MFNDIKHNFNRNKFYNQLPEESKGVKNLRRFQKNVFDKQLELTQACTKIKRINIILV